MDLGLKGKVAMVAGASKGLGFAIAKALAQEGANVSMVSRDEAAVNAAAEKIKAAGASGTAKSLFVLLPLLVLTSILLRTARQN